MQNLCRHREVQNRLLNLNVDCREFLWNDVTILVSRCYNRNKWFTAQTSAEYVYRYRSCLPPIWNLFCGDETIIFVRKKNCSPKSNYQTETKCIPILVMGRSLSYQFLVWTFFMVEKQIFLLVIFLSTLSIFS